MDWEFHLGGMSQINISRQPGKLPNGTTKCIYNIGLRLARYPSGILYGLIFKDDNVRPWKFQ